MTEALDRRECRGWPLVRAMARLSPAERVAAEGHLGLCRHCRSRLASRGATERTLAAAGTTTLGTGLAALVAKTVASGVAHASSLIGSAASGPVVAMTTAVALTAGAGGVVAAVREAAPAVAHPHVAPTDVAVRDGRHAVAPSTPASTAAPTASNPVASRRPGLLGRLKDPLRSGRTATATIPLPSPSAALPLPLPSVSIAPTRILPTSPPLLPLPLPSVTLAPTTLPTLPLP